MGTTQIRTDGAFCGFTKHENLHKPTPTEAKYVYEICSTSPSTKPRVLGKVELSFDTRSPLIYSQCKRSLKHRFGFIELMHAVTAAGLLIDDRDELYNKLLTLEQFAKAHK